MLLTFLFQLFSFNFPLLPCPVEDRVEQAREAGFEILAPQRHASLGPVLSDVDHSRFAKDLEVMGGGGFRYGQVNRPAGLLALGAEGSHHIKPHRVAQGVEDRGELEVPSIGMM